MGIEVNAANIICCKCGKSYSRRKGFFAVNYGVLYKGVGYLSVCKECVDKMYNDYLTECGDSKLAVRQMCRKLDLYWNEKVFEMVEKKSTTRTVMTNYIVKLHTNAYLGKSYDDTLTDEGMLWNFDIKNYEYINDTEEEKDIETEDEEIDVDDSIVDFWGRGLDTADYNKLESKKAKWLSDYPNAEQIDAPTELIVKQVCLLELDMDKKRANGGTVSEKILKAYTDLLGSANLKPVQKQKEDSDATIDKTPLGVWAQIYERERPIPEVDPELKDVDGIIRYISTWFLGHLCKMLGIKNTYCKLYEDAIENLRVEHPEFEDEDDDTMFDDIFAPSS